MVNKKEDLRIKIKEFVKLQQNSFRTVDVVEYSKTITGNIRLSPQRLQNYIREIKQVKFNKSKKRWEQQENAIKR